MTEVTVAEAKTRLSELLRAVEGGERVVITQHGKPVAELRAIASPQERWSLERVHARLRAMGVEPKTIPTPLDFDDPLPDSFWLGEEEA